MKFMIPKGTSRLLLLTLLAIPPAHAQDIRARIRSSPRGTAVSKSQADELTLTLTEAAVRPIQTWVRTAGAIDRTGKILTASVDPPSAALVRVGQRVRAFPPDSKSSMYQAWITRVSPQGGRAVVEATLTAPGRQNSPRYVMEIVVEQGRFLSIPNPAILEEGDKQIVYVQQQAGDYLPKEIHTGIQGELYTQVLRGLTEGDQVVTFGSFFIDSEHKLKATERDALSDDHQQHH
ncbi:MAG: hypothetical protein HW398_40 [Acidobacteria bacterium]|nr:hypothetical protein [Acidobacteriota bacterium]